MNDTPRSKTRRILSLVVLVACIALLAQRLNDSQVHEVQIIFHMTDLAIPHQVAGSTPGGGWVETLAREQVRRMQFELRKGEDPPSVRANYTFTEAGGGAPAIVRTQTLPLMAGTYLAVLVFELQPRHGDSKTQSLALTLQVTGDGPVSLR